MPSEVTSPLTIPKSTSSPSHRRRYKTEISFVSPVSDRHTFEEHSNCFLGISLENSNFRPIKVRSMVEWISRRFSRCTVLVGDSIHRITLESTRGLCPPEALIEAMRLGREFIDEHAHIFDDFRDRTDFTFINCSEVQTSDAYQSYHRALRDYFSQDSAFRTSVEAFGRRYHSKHSNGASAAELERRIQMSSDYFLEEFAIFCCLKEPGLEVESDGEWRPIDPAPGEFIVNFGCAMEILTRNTTTPVAAVAHRVVEQRKASPDQHDRFSYALFIDSSLDESVVPGLFRYEPGTGLELEAKFGTFLDDILHNTYQQHTTGLY
ncbi:tRNA-dependent cyclodipeptide synthase [Streptomyces sp. 769]|uniref:tRNA-dependent cyclodipeptide synthase n=1 Tax=Streptomyces sp. 769 TaxID=1262452 RepID=UPI00058223CC|nr:tRNA-dependent cyclodipeptide synthase [Streptomyces sp. 769]AJC60537.1 hypothetical protein GZL_07989 [Streptomyces sp. 769]